MPGHLEKRGKNTWKIVIELGRDPETKKRKRLVRTFKGPKREAEIELAKLISEYEKGLLLDTKITFGEYLKKWLEDYPKVKRLSPTTVRRYSQIINLRVIPKLGAIPLEKLRPIHLQTFYKELMDCSRLDGKKGSLSQASLIYHHRVIHKALDTAVKQQLIPYNIADSVELPKIQKEFITYNPDDEIDNTQAVKVLDEQQVNYMLEKARETPYYALLFLAVRTGMRRGELLALRWKDIDEKNKIIKVRQTLGYTPERGIFFKAPKTKKSVRNIDVSDDVIKVLKNHRRQQHEKKLLLGPNYNDYNLVFCQDNGLPMHPDTISSWFPEFLERIGLPRLNFHCLRHTHASLLLKAGVDVKIISERLGHSSVRITYDIYSHLMPGMQRTAAEKLEQLLS
ncbi:MAG: site-specific integrase [Thermosediminibacteraceae bacterium]|nr:site-specific integrase [Thermosediminibacteraceae bacterium]